MCCAPFAVIIIEKSVHYVTINLSTVDDWLWVDSMLLRSRVDVLCSFSKDVQNVMMCNKSYFDASG